MDYKMLNGADLSFIGDAYFELYIRTYLISKNFTKTKELKELSLKYVTAHAHSVIFDKVKDKLTTDEMQIFLRGRNADNSHRKNINRTEHQISSGFEAVIGYLYLENNIERLEELMKLSLQAIEE